MLLCGAALVFSTASARAGDDTKTTVHHKHHPKTAAVDRSAEADHSTRVKGADTIPTRDDRNSKEVSGGAAGGATGPEYRVPTGSMLPKHYDRHAHTTNTDDNTYIVDKQDQRIQDHNNLGDTLRDIPGVTVRGLR